MNISGATAEELSPRAQSYLAALDKVIAGIDPGGSTQLAHKRVVSESANTVVVELTDLDIPVPALGGTIHLPSVSVSFVDRGAQPVAVAGRIAGEPQLRTARATLSFAMTAPAFTAEWDKAAAIFASSVFTARSIKTDWAGFAIELGAVKWSVAADRGVSGAVDESRSLTLQDIAFKSADGKAAARAGQLITTTRQHFADLAAYRAATGAATNAASVSDVALSDLRIGGEADVPAFLSAKHFAFKGTMQPAASGRAINGALSFAELKLASGAVPLQIARGDIDLAAQNFDLTAIAAALNGPKRPGTRATISYAKLATIASSLKLTFDVKGISLPPEYRRFSAADLKTSASAKGSLDLNAITPQAISGRLVYEHQGLTNALQHYLDLPQAMAIDATLYDLPPSAIDALGGPSRQEIIETALPLLWTAKSRLKLDELRVSGDGFTAKAMGVLAAVPTGAGLIGGVAGLIQGYDAFAAHSVRSMEDAKERRDARAYYAYLKQLGKSDGNGTNYDIELDAAGALTINGNTPRPPAAPTKAAATAKP